MDNRVTIGVGSYGDWMIRIHTDKVATDNTIGIDIFNNKLGLSSTYVYQSVANINKARLNVISWKIVGLQFIFHNTNADVDVDVARFLIEENYGVIMFREANIAPAKYPKAGAFIDNRLFLG